MARFLKRAPMRQSADQGLVHVSRFRDSTLQLHAAACGQLFTTTSALLFLTAARSDSSARVAQL